MSCKWFGRAWVLMRVCPCQAQHNALATMWGFHSQSFSFLLLFLYFLHFVVLCLSVCLSVCLFVCFVCLFVCFLVYLVVCLNIFVSVFVFWGGGELGDNLFKQSRDSHSHSACLSNFHTILSFCNSSPVSPWMRKCSILQNIDAGYWLPSWPIFVARYNLNVQSVCQCVLELYICHMPRVLKAPILLALVLHAIFCMLCQGLAVVTWWRELT
jgi:hypothetical protein